MSGSTMSTVTRRVRRRGCLPTPMCISAPAIPAVQVSPLAPLTVMSPMTPFPSSPISPGNADACTMGYVQLAGHHILVCGHEEAITSSPKGAIIINTASLECNDDELEERGHRVIKLPIRDHPDDEEINRNFKRYIYQLSKIILDDMKFGDYMIIHCRRGISRSVTILCGLIMVFNECNYAKAIDDIRRTREIVNPNIGFIMLLENLEEEIQLWKKESLGVKEKLSILMRNYAASIPLPNC